MGCSTTTEELQEKILKLQLKRNEIREQKKKKIARLEKLTGEEIKKKKIPDYLEKSEDDDNSKKKQKNKN